MASARKAAGPCVLGLDLGTSSCKACLVDRRGHVAGEGRQAYTTHTPQPMWAEQDPVDWIEAVKLATRQALASSPFAARQVAAVSLTSAAHIGVLLDEAHRPVRRAILWNDQRSAAQVRTLERRAGEIILQASCQAASTGWTLAHLAWVRRHDARAWSRMRHVLLSKDYLGWWLTGNACTDPATAVSSQLWDVHADRWSIALCDLIKLSPDALPSVLPANAPIGVLTAAAADALGLLAGTPVINGSLDTATELLAAGVCDPGQGMIRLATAGGLQVVVATPTPHRGRITYPHLFTPHWYCQAGTNTCAAAVQWAVNLIMPGRQDPWAAWDVLASKVPPGAAGVMFHPYLAGERAPYWNPDLRASFTGLTLHHTPGHLARAVYEGVAFSIRDAMSVLADQPLADDPLAVSGGGARSRLWLDILAAVLGRRLRVVEGADSACGAALLGMAAINPATDLRKLAMSRAATQRLVKPRLRDIETYNASFERYRQAFRRIHR